MGLHTNLIVQATPSVFYLHVFVGSPTYTSGPRCTLMGEPFDFCGRGWLILKKIHKHSVCQKKSCYMEKSSGKNSFCA